MDSSTDLHITAEVNKSLKNLSNLISILNNDKVFGDCFQNYSAEKCDKFCTMLEMIESTAGKLKIEVKTHLKPIMDCNPKKVDEEFYPLKTKED